MGWLPLHLRRQVHYSNYLFRILNNQAPSQFSDMFTYVSGGSRDAEKCNLYITKSRTHKTFAYLGAKCWNLLADECRNFDDCKKFSKFLKSCFLNAITNDPLYSVDNKFDIFYTPAAFRTWIRGLSFHIIYTIYIRLINKFVFSNSCVLRFDKYILTGAEVTLNYFIFTI